MIGWSVKDAASLEAVLSITVMKERDKLGKGMPNSTPIRVKDIAHSLNAETGPHHLARRGI